MWKILLFKIFFKGNIAVSEEYVAQIVSMGFSQQKATKALIETDNNVARACEWIFSHIDEGDDPMDEIKPDAFTDGSSSKYFRLTDLAMFLKNCAKGNLKNGGKVMKGNWREKNSKT